MAQPQDSLSGMTGFPNLARMATRGGKLATLVSAFALAFSAASFYETVLKQAHIKAYVTDTISYTRDPYGGYEVFAVPVTIANSGARDGAIVTLTLTVKNLEKGTAETLSSEFTADAQYFGGREDVPARVKRPKQPFAPIAVLGRSAYAGTILFYTKEGRSAEDPRTLVVPQANLEMTLTVQSPVPDNWLDRTFYAPPASVALKGKVANFLPGALYAGDMVRVRLATTEANAK
ncbi:MAG: hypothetical protein EKK41_16075 [Hyphomicrobiales bacterium]|nr:MAG: hypothetical protein EKK41_16075 [Hyphomicrobiales bacterium]